MAKIKGEEATTKLLYANDDDAYDSNGNNYDSCSMVFSDLAGNYGG